MWHLFSIFSINAVQDYSKKKRLINKKKKNGGKYASIDKNDYQMVLRFKNSRFTNCDGI